MTVYQCPKCELKFSWRTERDHHCREEHPDFQHEYRESHPEQPPPPVTREVHPHPAVNY